MKPKVAPDKVAIYIRWSTEDQGLGHTLEIQRESCRYYALSQGWSPREDLTYIDEGFSGGNLDRPALTRLRAAVRAGHVDCVVVYKLDRLSRNIKDIINLVLDEWEDDCCVRSTQEPVDTTSDAGKMFFTMLGSFADFERSAIRTRTWSGKRKNAEKGRNPGMAYPYGYAKSEDRGWAVVEDEAAVVRQIFDLYLKGKSCRLIAFDLNARGYRTRSGRLWAGGEISRLLRNPLYAGRLVYNRRACALKRKLGRVPAKDAAEVITCEGAAPAIVDAETWAQAERLRAARPRIERSAPARAHSSPYLLAGLLRCTCGHAWIGIQGGKRGERFYTCAGARAQGPAKCASRSVKAETLDAFVLDRVRQTWAVKPPFRPNSPGASGRLREQAARQKTLRQRVETLDAALVRFREDYKAARIDAGLFQELSKETRAERQQMADLLEAALADQPTATAPTAAAAICYAALDPWTVMLLSEQQQVLRQLITQVTVSRPKGCADLDVHVQWRLPRAAGT
jgi:site-specific DNA recombinase